MCGVSACTAWAGLLPGEQLFCCCMVHPSLVPCHKSVCCSSVHADMHVGAAGMPHPRVSTCVDWPQTAYTIRGHQISKSVCLNCQGICILSSIAKDNFILLHHEFAECSAVRERVPDAGILLLGPVWTTCMKNCTYLIP